MWKFLTDFVGAGRAGWGVWCYMVETEGGDGEGGEEEGGVQGGECEMTVYCWGEVVAHIYVVLFLASERMIKGIGASWLDAGGKVVVQMR